jgi:nickel-dependent lactate racemase
MAVVRYGIGSCVEIESANGSAPGELDVPRSRPWADVTAAPLAALNEPLDYPPLARCLTPVDRVVLALDRGVPQAAQITAAVIHALIQAGIDPEAIAILQSSADREADTDDPRRLLPTALRSQIALPIHDPTDRRQLAYLAANDSGEAILIGRMLHEADVVLTIGCLHGDAAAGYFGIHNAVYPAFSDAKTLQRFRGLGSLNSRGARKRELTAEADHVGWLLGINLTVQVVPSAGDEVSHVLAGQSEAVRKQGRELYHAAWDWPVSRRAGLVVAAIEGGPSQQTWDNVGRALQAAGRFVEEGGAIAICSELAAQPGPAVQQLAAATSRETALRHIGHERPFDALPAAQLAHALDRGKVYLLSRLNPPLVEDLDMIPVERPEELARLAARHESCTIVGNAPYVNATDEMMNAE